MKKDISWKLTAAIKYLFFVVLQLAAVYGYSQYYEQKPEPEFAIGMRVLKSKIIYGQKSFYITDPNSISLQALVRYDAPIIKSTYSPYQHNYFNFVL